MTRQEKGRQYRELLKDTLKYPTQKDLAKELNISAATICISLKEIGCTKKYEIHRTSKRNLSDAHKKSLGNSLSGKKSKLWVHGVPKNYLTLHRRIRDLYGTPDTCENSTCSGQYRRYQWSNTDHKYDSLDREKWQRLCFVCHMQYDRKHNPRSPI